MMLDLAIAKAVHITAAVLWVGSTFFMVRLLAPATAAAGPAGGQVMQALLLRTRFTLLMPLFGVLTVAAGGYLYWRLAYFEVPQSSLAMMSLNLGVAAGLAMLIVGLALQGPVAATLKLHARTLSEAQGQPPTDAVANMQQDGAKMLRLGRVQLAIGMVALAGMSLFRYL